MAFVNEPDSRPASVLPLAVPADALRQFERAPQREVLEADVLASQAAAAQRIEKALAGLAEDEDLRAAPETVPAQWVLTLKQPDGEPARGLHVVLAEASWGEDQWVAVRRARPGTVLSDGSVVLHPPATWARLAPDRVHLVVTGADGPEQLELPFPVAAAGTALTPVTLPRPMPPAPLALWPNLGAVAAAGGDVPDQRPEATQPEVAIGEDGCHVVFRSDPSQDRFPWGVLFRLTDPAVSAMTLVHGRPVADGERLPQPLHPVFPDSNLPPNALLHLTDRAAIERPIAVDAFTHDLSGVATPRVVPMASTLAIGYVVHLAQRWSQRGLALGDLVYSLPLAPGEQQRIAVMERTETTSVMEREALEQREDLRFDEADTSSVHATFAAGFQESARGGSSYQAHSDSFSIAAAAGGGGIFPFGVAAGGVATSYGSANASGSTSTWMSGARQSVANSAQQTQAAVSRRASAVRQSSRAAMRLATASETSQITTKVITNHNKTRALTMQYWEVLRVFDVATVVEDVSLVCLVPLDVVDFLPAGEGATLDANALDRPRVLHRYERLLRHSDVLARVVPWRLRRGLQALNDFAADPRATVQAPTGAAMQVITVSVEVQLCTQDSLSVQLLLRGGARTATVPLSVSGTGPAPLPREPNAFKTEDELFAALRSARAGHHTCTASIALPASVGLQDVVGCVLRHSLQRLWYTFAPIEVLGTMVRPPLTRTFDAGRLNQELGDLLVYNVDAVAAARNVVQQHWSAGAPVPASGLTVAAQRLPPELSYDALLSIERTLQWVLRHTMQCSTHVVAALTAEERAVMLERYSVIPPTLGPNGEVVEGVPLLSCITNNVLGYFGNAMVMPFQIPLALAERAEVDSATLQRALKRFHTEAFDHPPTSVVLPTRGVLGEAVLGRCPSAEKIDLTRFWNWQDSPGDEATAIAPVAMPTDHLTAGAEAPSKLTSLSPIINNFSTQGPGPADTSLATAIAGKALELAKPFDVAALTNAANLKSLLEKTTDTAESARKDALSAAKEITIKAMETSAALRGAKKDADKKDKKDKDKDKDSGDEGDGGGDGDEGGNGDGGDGDGENPQPMPDAPPPPPPQRPATLHVFFNLNESTLVDETNEGRGDQDAAIAKFIDAAKAFHATHLVVRGYASPEGTLQRNHELVRQRADVLAQRLSSDLEGVRVTTAVGGIVSGPPSSKYPELRRADAEVTAP